MEIKFRIPIECNNCGNKAFQYLEWNGQEFIETGYDKCNCGNQKYQIVGNPQLFTGKVDKSETDVFGGDILAEFTGKTPTKKNTYHIGVVVFDDVNSQYKLKTIKTTRKQLYRYESLITCEHKAIIGNNHKNPELLEGLNGKTD